jgi:hypothetical protein
VKLSLFFLIGSQRLDSYKLNGLSQDSQPITEMVKNLNLSLINHSYHHFNRKLVTKLTKNQKSLNRRDSI